MQREEKVKVLIKLDGSGDVKVECENFIGEGCNAIADIENQLGFVSNRKDTDEKLYQIPDPQFITI